MKRKFIGYSYNLTFGGEGGDTFSLHDEETKKLISSKISKSNKGKPKSIEHRNKISKALLGKPSWNKGKPSPNKGKHITEEHKQKISKANKGIIFTEEHKQKLVEAWKVRKLKGFSEETKQKMSLAHKGKTTWNKGLKGEYAASIETRQKLSQDTSNRRWIHNEFENKYVKYWELDKYLEQGFILGRLNKNSPNSNEN